MARSLLFTALKLSATEQDKTQRDIADAIGRDNAWLWSRMDSEEVVFEHLKEAVAEVDSQIFIRSRRSQKLTYVLNEKSSLSTAIKHLTFDFDMSQQGLTDKLGVDTAHFWEFLRTEQSKFIHIKRACFILDADIIIQQTKGRKAEFVVNPKEE